MFRPVPRLRAVDTLVACAAALLALGVCGCTIDSINHGAMPCTAETCDGCCTAYGACLAGDNVFACGVHAASCQTCEGLEICSEGSCVQQSEPLNPDDGGEPDACGPQSCDGCCADGACVVLTDETDAQCGVGGQACYACTGAASGCVEGSCRHVPRCRLSITVEHHTGYGVIDFGNILLGTTGRVEISLKNVGDAVCEVTEPDWFDTTDKSAFSFNGGPAYASEIEPGSTAKFPVTFTPYKVGSWNGFDNGFTFVVNDGAVSECANDTRGCRRIYLTGAGQKFSLQPRAPLLPEGVDFGEVALGCESGQKPVLLINESSATLNVSSVLTNRPEFETLSSPTKIDPWSTGTIYVRFVPSAEGPLTGKLSVTDDVGGSRSIPLSGTGTASGAQTRTETFTQRLPAYADVLFVVRAGPNMGPLQDALANNSNVIFDRAATAGGAVRAGVVSADVSLANAGLLQGASKWVDPSATAPDQLATNVRVGTAVANDLGFEAARLALSPPNSSDPLLNGGFLRNGAKLGLIFVSDGLESSGGTIDSYAQVFRAAARTPVWNGVRVYPILSGNGCAQSAHYSEAASLMGGLCQSLSTSSVTQALQAVAQDLFQSADEFVLSEPVELSAPWSVVLDDGTVVSSAYVTLDSGHNSVRFSQNHPPPVGQQFTVTYQADCHP